MGGPWRTRAEDEFGDGADARQRLSPEAERGQAVQVLKRGEFRRGVALDRQFKLGRRHAVPVVGYLNQVEAAAANRDLDAPGSGVECVFDQLLDD